MRQYINIFTIVITITVTIFVELNLAKRSNKFINIVI